MAYISVRSARNIVLVIGLATVAVFPQRTRPTPKPIPTPVPVATPTPLPDLPTILAGATDASRAYTETFKNLIADESKVFVLYGKSGDEKKQRTVVSNFLVYQSADEKAAPAEFRNIISVDGKPVSNGETRIKEFFEKVVKADNSTKELKQIFNESTREDLGFALTGYTLLQAVPLWEELRGTMSFSLVGPTDIDGHPVIAVKYTQTADSQYISVNNNIDVPETMHSQVYEVETNGKKVTSPRLSGTLYFDAETYRLRRETRSLSINVEGLERPAVAIEQSFDYQDSELGILTPTRISHLQYRINPKTGLSTKELQVTFTYGKFSRPNVEVTSSDVTQD